MILNKDGKLTLLGLFLCCIVMLPFFVVIGAVHSINNTLKKIR